MMVEKNLQQKSNKQKTKLRWWKLGIISYNCHRTFILSPSWFCCFVASELLLVPYLFNRRRLKVNPLSVCPSICFSVHLLVFSSVCPSVLKIGSHDNAKRTENIFYETWYMDRWQSGYYARLFFFLCWKFWLLWQI
jgi:hypothetical protein